MAGVEDHSEFEGGGVQRNTIFPKGADALTAADKLRLDSITGQTSDPNAQPNPWHWQGGNFHPDELAQIEQDRRNRVQRGRQLQREERDRYKESPY